RSFTQEDLTVLTGNVQRPNGIVWLDGKLYIACSGDWTIYQVDAESGATITYISGIRDAHQMYAEETAAGFNLWIPDFDSGNIALITQQRTPPRVITSDNLNGPWGIAALNDEEMVITNLRGNSLSIVNKDGTSRPLTGEFRSPAGIVIAGDFAYVSNNGSARRAIEWFSTSEMAGTITPRPLVSGLQNVSSMAAGADGFLYFTYSLGTRGVVGRVQPDECRENGCTNEQVEIVVYTELPAPLAGLTLSPDMQLFVHTIYRPEIYRVAIYGAS
ncbi:MAG: hypothetical protein MUE40_08730, partial [Anaerolineae bacterium]|nr:hypothetical protein [Anaerolineae bacterium]